VAETSTEVVRRYLENAIAAEEASETQLREFAAHRDDDEVQSAFAAHAEQTRRQHERLSARLQELGGGTASKVKSILGHLFALTPQAVQATHTPEEGTAQNLITAFAVESGECAMYEAFATIAAAAGDPATEALAREIQAEERAAANQIAGFIPSRSKIALNMLTVSETDPAVETRAPANRVL
jgi:ferritin-like metal-binding protein YciE